MKKYHDYVIDGYLADNDRIIVTIRQYTYTEKIIDGFIYQSGEIDFKDNRVAELIIRKTDGKNFETLTVYNHTNYPLALRIMNHFDKWGDCYRYFRAINRKKNPHKRVSILKVEV